MARKLRSDSPRKGPAKQFGRELVATLKRRRVSRTQLALDLGMTRQGVSWWTYGNSLPRLDTAVRVAEYLDNDRLSQIVREARTATCSHCGATHINEGSSMASYCSACAPLAKQLCHADRMRRMRQTESTPAAVFREFLAQHQGEGQGRLEVYQSAVAAFCDDCEPEGVCRTADCPLRPVSPLPMTIVRNLRRLSA